MKSPLENVNDLDSVISTLQKMDSLMDSGRFIYANRILHKLLAEMERAKNDIIAEAKATSQGVSK